MSHDTLRLRAGPFTVDIEAGDLRRITLGGVEVVNRVYAAVRDGAWNTVPGAMRDLVVERGHRSFRVAYTADHEQGVVRFHNQVELTGDADGRIRVAMRGTALSAFERNRIGLCVLHPQACAGAWVRVGHSGGSVEERSFPTLIAPHQPFFDVASLTTRPLPGTEVTVRFAGEVFETEDQRNWGDASFKTYSTPAALPRPVAISAGTVVQQAVEIILTGRAGPQIAADIAALPHGPAVIAGLRACRLDRLRCEVAPGDGMRDRLETAATIAGHTGLPIDLVYLGEPSGQEPAIAGLPLASLVALPADRSTTPPVWVARMAALRPNLPVGGGSASQFTELNRSRPQAGGWPVLAFPVSPYVHAIDASTLLENAETLPAMIASAQAIMPGAAIHVALSHARLAGRADLAARHDGEIAGRWLAAVLAAASGVSVLSCGPTTGPMGLVRADGSLTPAGQVLADR
jgi:D-apionolactonase